MGKKKLYNLDVELDFPFDETKQMEDPDPTTKEGDVDEDAPTPDYVIDILGFDPKKEFKDE